MIAHSLGNMVVSSAIQDHNLKVDNYFMLEAAVASECYDASQFNTAETDNPMVPTAWAGYHNFTWCSCWHVLFGQFEFQSRLTWVNRFSNVTPQLYNFHSSGDEVLELRTPHPPLLLNGTARYAWQKQEVYKGTDNLGGFLVGSSWLGWGFEPPQKSPAQANGSSIADLRANPAFRHEPLIPFFGLFTDDDQNAILAKGIPALSGPAGGGSGIPIGCIADIDVNTEPLYKPNGWPPERGTDTSWLHSDWRETAYYYTFVPYTKFVSIGGLK